VLGRSPSCPMLQGRPGHVSVNPTAGCRLERLAANGTVTGPNRNAGVIATTGLAPPETVQQKKRSAVIGPLAKVTRKSYRDDRA
jgi:hypothetical protein